MEESDDPSANVFEPAFIMPTYDGAGGSNDTLATFDLNLETTGEIIGPSDPPTPLFRQSVGLDDYWVGYFLIGYQGKLVADADPLSEGGLLLGLTGSAKGDKSRDTLKFGVPTGGFGSIVFMEPAKEGPSIGFPEDVFNSTAAHEMGHQFGLGGDDNKREFGIMSQPPPSNPSAGRPSYEFVDDHLNVLRSRIKTPGMK